jgi:hypothetical protein
MQSEGTDKMDKVCVDGKVAVLYSPGYGAGWSTWNSDIPELVFDPTLVQMVLDRVDLQEMKDYCSDKWFNKDLYLGGLEDLCVYWVPQGERFRIDEYDGSESVVLLDNEYWFTA